MKKKEELVFGEDYYISENNKWVFTEKYHLDRGFCCSVKENIKFRCKHCPYLIENHLLK